MTEVKIGDALFWESDRIPFDNQHSPPLLPVEELSGLIEKTADKLIKAELENWHSKLHRARARDEERLHTYYGTISSEIGSKIESRRLMGESKDKELARLDATNRELERKLADLKERYALCVEASLHSAMVLHLPTVHIQCTLQRKKAKRIVTAVWNPFTKIIEPLRCELSGEPVNDFYLEDKDAKIISPTIWGEK